jgi:DNA modification methylase
MSGEWKNKLYFGDNLDILRDHIPSESVDLIYLDPPFKSDATYNVLFREKSGEESAAQITAFEDTWHWGLESEKAFYEIVQNGPKKLADLIQVLRSFLGQNDMMAYLTMMAIRLAELHRVLKLAGSIYLHCDPTASHYLKLVMDDEANSFVHRHRAVGAGEGAGQAGGHHGERGPAAGAGFLPDAEDVRVKQANKRAVSRCSVQSKPVFRCAEERF